VIRKELR